MENIKKVFVLLLVIALASCAPANEYCPPKETNKFLKVLNQIDRKWTVAYNTAGKVEKINLDGAIQDLLTLKQEVESIEGPECLEPAKNAFIRYMQKIIEGFTAIKTGKSEVTVQRLFDSSDEYLDEFYSHIYEIEGCLPNCAKPE